MVDGFDAEFENGGTVGSEISSAMAAALLFAMHVVVGMGLFALVAGAAILLAIGKERIEKLFIIPSYVSQGVTGLEALLFLVDGVCFAFFIGVEALKFCKRILAGIQKL